MRLSAGTSARLGTSWDGRGTNFALFSANAQKVELCLFDPQGRRELERIELPERSEDVWHGYLNDVSPGQLYGYRVHGPYEPEHGHRFNANKLLLDPYAKRLAGRLVWSDAHFAYRTGSAREDLSFDRRDNARGMPKAVVVDESFNWGRREMRPNIPWEDTIIYEAHVKGLTQKREDVPPNLRGTYGGLSSRAMIEHLKRLGVTTIELLPVHGLVDDRMLVEKKLSNYWGYNTLSFFAPEPRYSQDNPLDAFRTTVARLHDAGIEVLLDVVYNHTAEGNHMGPLLSFKGIDNAAYYRRCADQPRFYMDYTGTGNSLNMRHPHVLQLIMDSLRYWILEMHVDGFRFDLASTLARGLHDVDRLSAFFDLIHQDPVVSQVKLIAEPWDVGEGGYQVGNFPVLWTEWNGRYRDTIRDFWRGARTGVADLAYRLTGSSDLYQSDGRRPYASINFVTAHDGFTLHDLVSYNDKHNQANGEDNRDGSNDNRSWNCGVEGPTRDPEVVTLRDRQKRNLVVTLLLSSGVPMLLAGDEMGRTQLGNNNAYCQDNEVSWLDWDLNEGGRALLEHTRALIALRAAHPVFRRHRFFQGQALHGSGVKDIGWFTSDGVEMDEASWRAPDIATLGVFLNGDEIPDRGPRGEHIVDDSFLLLLHGGAEPAAFTLPGSPWAKEYELVLDTASPTPPASTPPDNAEPATVLPAGDRFVLPPRS